MQLFFGKPKEAVLSRPDYNEAEAEYTLFYKEQDSTETGTLKLTVPPREYGKEKLSAMAEEVFACLPQYFLAENPDMDSVSSDLTFPGELEGYPFEITWLISDDRLISSGGQVHNSALLEPGLCSLTAILSYDAYEVSQDYCVNVIPAEYTRAELREAQIAGAIYKWMEKHLEETEFVLPTEFEGAYVYGRIPNQTGTLLWGVLGVIGLIFHKARVREAAKETEEKHKKYLRQMYPLMVNQLVLYMSAGMTSRNALRQVMVSLKSSEEPCKAALYQELCSLFYELENGVSEQEAYKSFGKRCGPTDYGKLMSLLVQTIMIGGKGVFARMEELLEDGFARRKEDAKSRGEEASTKLLIPMILLLAVVMVMLIIPGFYGMGYR